MEAFDYAVVAPEYYTKAREHFKSRGKSPEYRCKGTIGRSIIYDYISCTDEEKAILQGLESQRPGEDLSYLLRTCGYEDLSRQIEGEDGFYLESIDWTPVHTFRFSLIRYSKYSHKPKGDREPRFVCLEDEEYLAILTRRLMSRNYSFSMLFSEHPEIAGRILNQINSPYEYGGGMNEPYVVFMDEVEEEAEAILGAPSFSARLYFDEAEESENVFVSASQDLLKVSKYTKASYPLSIRDISGIPCKLLREVCRVVDDEDLLMRMYEQFAGADAFERIQTFLSENKVPCIVNENGSLIQ